MWKIPGLFAKVRTLQTLFQGDGSFRLFTGSQESELVKMDPIGDALIRIKNGYRVGKESVALKYSKLILHLVKLLQKEGYLSDVKVKDREIVVSLSYQDRKPVLTDIKRVSKPSLRVYKGAKQLPKVLNGLGIAVVSTPKGLLTDKEARKMNVGGEVLALIW